MKTFAIATNDIRVQKGCMSMPFKAMDKTSTEAPHSSQDVSFAAVLSREKGTASTPASIFNKNNPTMNNPDMNAGLISKLVTADSSPKTKQINGLAVAGSGCTNTCLPNVGSATTEWNTWNVYSEQWMKFDDTPAPVGYEYRYNPQTNERKAVKSCGTELGTTGGVLPQFLSGTNTCPPNVGSATTEWNTWNIYPEQWMKFDDTPAPVGYEYRYNPQTNERKAVKSCGTELGTTEGVLPQFLSGTNTCLPNVGSATINRPIVGPSETNQDLLIIELAPFNQPIVGPGGTDQDLIERFEQRLIFVGIGSSPNIFDSAY